MQEDGGDGLVGGGGLNDDCRVVERGPRFEGEGELGWVAHGMERVVGRGEFGVGDEEEAKAACQHNQDPNNAGATPRWADERGRMLSHAVVAEGRKSGTREEKDVVRESAVLRPTGLSVHL